MVSPSDHEVRSQDGSAPPWLRFSCTHSFESGFRLEAEFACTHPITALFGPSGSGKSTILAAVAGLFVPHRSAIELRGRTLSSSSERVWLPPERRHIGMMFQDYRLLPHLSVESNLRYGIRRGRESEAFPSGDLVSVEEVASALELDTLFSRKPRSLSGGEQERVALARAVLGSPQALLLDEPLSSIERPLRERIAGFLIRVASDLQVPILLVTHDGEVVERLGAAVVALQDGRVECP